MKSKTILLTLFLVMVALMPFIRWNIMSVGAFELTFSDFFTLVIFGSSIFLFDGLKISNQQNLFLVSLLTYIFSLTFSSINAANLSKLMIGFLPLIYAVIIVVATANVLNRVGSKVFDFLYKVILGNLLIIAVSFYIGFLGIVPVMSFLYSGDLWRFKYFTQNPNQLAVYIVTSLYVLAIISMRYKKNRLKWVFYLSLILLLPIMASGSRTGLFANVGIVLILAFNLFFSMNLKKKILTSVILYFGIIYSFFTISIYLDNQNSVFQRSISVFTTILTGGINPSEMGPTGETIVAGLSAFGTRPILGIGFSNMTEIFHHETHNTFVSTLAETGVVGFTGLLIFIGTMVYLVFNSRSRLLYKLSVFGFFILFIAMTYAHNLFRQRWVWFYFIIMITISNTKFSNSNISSSS